MGESRNDRRARALREAKVGKRALPIVKDSPFRAPIRLRYAMSLSEGVAPRAVLDAAHREADALGARLLATAPSPDCAAGCAHCCQNPRVGVNATEAQALAAHVRALPLDERERVRQRVGAAAAMVREAAPGSAPRVTCALLGDDARCSVYALRPFVCRRAHSFDVERCRKAAAGEESDILSDARVLAVYGEIATAFREASAAFGADSGSFELHQALDILLRDSKGDLSPAREKSDPERIRALARSVNGALK
jgi:Fe-S-cluster containining protein